MSLTKRRYRVDPPLPSTYSGDGYLCAFANGYEKLFSFVRADNPAALTTYLNQGFTVMGTPRNQAKINGRHVDEIIIERQLGDS